MATGTVPPDHLRGGELTHEEWVLRQVWKRVNEQNEHFMGCIVGREGSGKSYTALKIARGIDPTFTADRVIFEIADLLEVLRDGEHEPGQFYVLDEAGAQLGKRTWQDRAQVLANQALQLIRSHNLGLIFTLPRLGELDSQAQGRLQAFLEMTEKVEGEYVELKWKWMSPDRADHTGEIYKKYPRRPTGGTRLRLERLRFYPPSDDIVEPYEEAKGEFQEQFYDKTISKLREADADQDGGETLSPKEVAAEIKEKGVDDVVSIHGGNKQPYIDAGLIELEYDTSQRDAKKVKKVLERDDEVEL